MKPRIPSTPGRKARRSRAAHPAAAPRRTAQPPGELALDSDCSLTAADALKAALAALLEAPQTVTLDAGAVQRIDTAALQLLAAFVRDRRLGGRTVAWRGAAQALQPAARLLGMEGILGFDGEPR